MWYEYIIYNPFTWMLILLLGGCFLSWLIWYCKTTFKLEGSWKKLDKSINFREKK